MSIGSNQRASCRKITTLGDGQKQNRYFIMLGQTFLDKYYFSGDHELLGSHSDLQFGLPHPLFEQEYLSRLHKFPVQIHESPGWRK